jgi:hypothetical protein
MRTTITLDDRLFKDLKNLAHESGAPLRDVLEKALREGLRFLRAAPRPRPYRGKTFHLGRPTGLNFDRALNMAAEGEDEEVLRKLMLRK